MFQFFSRKGRPALLWSTIKATAAIAFLATFVTGWLSSETFDRSALVRLAGAITPSGALDDPATTGSLAQAAGGARLDPCLRQGRF